MLILEKIVCGDDFCLNGFARTEVEINYWNLYQLNKILEKQITCINLRENLRRFCATCATSLQGFPKRAKILSSLKTWFGL